jgi:transposase
LGCPVRFFLTAGQAGDAPQAQRLVEGLAAEIVMADAAYDSDAFRAAVAAKGAQAAPRNDADDAVEERRLGHGVAGGAKMPPGRTSPDATRRFNGSLYDLAATRQADRDASAPDIL